MTARIIRLGRLADVAAVAEITRDAFGRALARADLEPHQVAENELTMSMGAPAFRAALTGQDVRTWVAVEGDRIVGFIVASNDADSDFGQINWMAVRTSHQRRGVGRALLQTALDWIGARDVDLTVVEYNVSAIDLYRKFGFKQTGKLRQFAVPRVLMVRSEGPVTDE